MKFLIFVSVLFDSDRGGRRLFLIGSPALWGVFSLRIVQNVAVVVDGIIENCLGLCVPMLVL